MMIRTRRTGFSLLEMALTLGIAGTVLSGIWQLMGSTGQTREAAILASQAQALAAASAQYIAAQRGVLMALPDLAAADGSDAIRIKITDADAGSTATSIVGLGYLPSSFSNINTYGQSYQLYVRREDGGTLGVADSNDTLVGLLISTGGTAMSDNTGARVSGLLGAAGGFLYAADNAASPATLARGTANGWQVDFTAAGWLEVTASLGGSVEAGHIAILTNLTTPNSSGAGGGGAGGSGGGGSIDELSDGATDYTTRYNIFIGQDVGINDTLGGYSTGVGFEALKLRIPPAINARNTALGYGALRGYALWPGTPTGVENVAVGHQAGGYVSTGSANVAIGSGADRDHESSSGRVAVGYYAGMSAGGDNTTFIGSYAGASLGSYPGATYSTVVGAQSGRGAMGSYNTFVGARIGYDAPHTGFYNTAMGYEALHRINAGGEYNLALGYRAGYNLSTGDNNILIGNNVDAPDPAGNNQINIGNLIYGDSSTQQLSIGSSTLVSGIAFDVGGRTDATRLAVGDTAQQPTCDMTLQGAQRFNTDNYGVVWFCDGTSWVEMSMIPGGATPPTMPTNDGYIVLSKSKWDGNLGSELGIRKKCLQELTTYDWMGKATAVANGQLAMGKVEAMIWWQEGGGSCHDKQFHPVPNARYYFAVADRPTVGGGYVITNSIGDWFPDATTWTGANQFDGFYSWWGGNIDCDAGLYGCNGYVSNSAAIHGSLGFSASVYPQKGVNGYFYYYDQRAFSTKLATCDTTQRLVCLVHP